MRRNSSKDQPRETTPVIEYRDSPTIQNLIAQLDRDLKEAERKVSKAQ